MTLARAHASVQRFDLAVVGYERALALSPGLTEAAVELGEVRAAAVQHAAHASTVAAAAADAVSAARQRAQRHVLPPGARAQAQPNGSDAGPGSDGSARGVTRPRGDAARPREHRRGLWGGELDDADDDGPPAQIARTTNA